MYRTRICCMVYAPIYISGPQVAGQVMHLVRKRPRQSPRGTRNRERVPGLDLPARISYNLREQGMGMSESAVEGLAGDTGEVVAPESTDSALEGHEEDQAAEE